MADAVESSAGIGGPWLHDVEVDAGCLRRDVRPRHSVVHQLRVHVGVDRDLAGLPVEDVELILNEQHEVHRSLRLRSQPHRLAGLLDRYLEATSGPDVRHVVEAGRQVEDVLGRVGTDLREHLVQAVALALGAGLLVHDWRRPAGDGQWQVGTARADHQPAGPARAELFSHGISFRSLASPDRACLDAPTRWGFEPHLTQTRAIHLAAYITGYRPGLLLRVLR